ncbi:hypothetical protein R1sor_022062 [Riccia sorocarpa]|uniref:RRM domain-containing protein n=1 Tax=Riccia sorocarpa TaxID=122646 RepID=A0ABD3GML3_9MARC
MEAASMLHHPHPYSMMQQQQSQHLPQHHSQHQQPHQQASQQQQPSQVSSGIYDQQQQSAGGQAVGGSLIHPPSSMSNPTSTTIGQKRDFSGHPISGSPQDSHDGGNFVKLFVGSVPRSISEEEVRPLFAEHGNVLEVALIKDKRTGQQQDVALWSDYEKGARCQVPRLIIPGHEALVRCCFIKYGTIEEAERAIRALNNQRTLPGGTAPVQVRYADGERERLGAVEHKLFVGSLNKQATEKEIQELFAPYGRVDDVYIMRDEQKQSRGCAFIKYPTREMATAAINALNGVYVMPGCDQPLAVRFADPKRPKGGDTRVGGPGFGGPGFSPRPGGGGHRPAPAPMGGQMGGRGPPMGWRPMGGPGLGPQPQLGPAYAGGMGPRGAAGNVPSPMGGPLPGPAGPMNGHLQGPMAVPGQLVGPTMLPPAQQPGYYQPSNQRQPQNYGQQASPQQQAYGQLPVTQQPPNQPQQLLSMQQLQQPLQLGPMQGPPQQQHQHPQQLQQQQLPPPQQQMQPQPQMQQQQPQPMLQPQQQQQQQQQQQVQQQAPQQQPQQQQQVFYQVPALQQAQQQVPPASWLLPVQPQAVATMPPPPSIPATCEWTEHTSPEGYKYYYNSATGESKCLFATAGNYLPLFMRFAGLQWEKPEELISFEQQQQQPPQQQPPPQIQQLPVTAPQGLSYGQPQSANGSVEQPRQQGPPGANLFVFRIPDDFTDETLKETFDPFGNVISARVGVERESGRNRGFGFVSYDSASSAEAAIQGLNNVAIGGRRLKVERKRGEQTGDQNFQPY